MRARVCPDCHGFKKVTVNDWIFGRGQVCCRLCGGRGVVYGNRPGKRGVYSRKKNAVRLKASVEIQERRRAAKAAKKAEREYARILGLRK